MTKELLERYPALCLELKELKRSGRFPERCRELEAQKSQIEAFQQGLADPRQRLVVYLRAMQGLSWKQVSARMEGEYSGDYLRSIYREAKKFLN